MDAVLQEHRRLPHNLRELVVADVYDLLVDTGAQLDARTRETETPSDRETHSSAAGTPRL